MSDASEESAVARVVASEVIAAVFVLTVVCRVVMSDASEESAAARAVASEVIAAVFVLTVAASVVTVEASAFSASELVTCDSIRSLTDPDTVDAPSIKSILVLSAVASWLEVISPFRIVKRYAGS